MLTPTLSITKVKLRCIGLPQATALEPFNCCWSVEPIPTFETWQVKTLAILGGVRSIRRAAAPEKSENEALRSRDLCL